MTTEATGSIDPRQTLPLDFYYSFRFSQGSPDLQLMLLKVVGLEYQKIASPEAMIGLLDSSEGSQRELLTGMHKPKSHRALPRGLTPLSQEQAAGGERGLFTEYVDEFQKVFSDIVDGSIRESTRIDKLEAVTEMTIARDINYQRGRRSYGTDDPHSSYFRQYVLLGETTNSRVYDSIFNQIAELEVDGTMFIPDGLEYLRQTWESNHPGQNFNLVESQ